MLTFNNLRAYYIRKIFRYVPLNVIALLTMTELLPMFGSGPIWNFYKKLINGCG